MSSRDHNMPPPTELDAYRAEKQKEAYIRSAIEKTESLRNLLNDTLAAFNSSSGPGRQIIAFGVSDALRSVSKAEMDYLREILHRAFDASSEE